VGNPDASRSSGRASGVHALRYLRDRGTRPVAPAGGALSVVSGLLLTAVATIDLAAVTVAADNHLSLAANAKKEPARHSLRLSIARRSPQ
jgi:hypothetical protein